MNKDDMLENVGQTKRRSRIIDGIEQCAYIVRSKQFSKKYQQSPRAPRLFPLYLFKWKQKNNDEEQKGEVEDVDFRYGGRSQAFFVLLRSFSTRTILRRVHSV
jgi:hypothetical protein